MISINESICNITALVGVISAVIIIIVNNPVNSVLWLIVSFVAVACYLITAGIAFIGLSYIIVYVGAIAVLFLFVVMMLNIASITSVDNNSDNTLKMNTAMGTNNTDINTDSNTATYTNVNTSSISNKTWPLAILIVIVSVFTIIDVINSSINFNMPISIISYINQFFYSNYGGIDTIISYNYVSWVPSINSDSALIYYGVGPITQVQILGMSLYTHGTIWLLMISVLLILAILVPLALAFV